MLLLFISTAFFNTVLPLASVISTVDLPVIVLLNCNSMLSFAGLGEMVNELSVGYCGQYYPEGSVCDHT